MSCIAHVSPLAEGLDSWFALWIPLRRRETLEGKEPIRNGDLAFPGDNPKCPKDLIHPIKNSDPTLGELLPLLRHLKTVQFHDGASFTHLIHRNPEQGIIQNGLTQTTYSIVRHADPDKAKDWKERSAWPRVYRDKGGWFGGGAPRQSRLEPRDSPNLQGKGKGSSAVATLLVRVPAGRQQNLRRSAHAGGRA